MILQNLFNPLENKVLLWHHNQNRFWHYNLNKYRPKTCFSAILTYLVQSFMFLTRGNELYYWLLSIQWMHWDWTSFMIDIWTIEIVFWCLSYQRAQCFCIFSPWCSCLWQTGPLSWLVGFVAVLLRFQHYHHLLASGSKQKVILLAFFLSVFLQSPDQD